MSRKLPNYLKTYRKKCGFSQNEMALLLGCRSGAKVSRFEHYKRDPDLRTALACQVMFGIPANEIFPGIFAEVEKVTKEQAMLLSRKLEYLPSTPLTLRKKDILSRMTSGREVVCRQNI
jgi:transcriptional regulator with XRE-family HTH domain